LINQPFITPVCLL